MPSATTSDFQHHLFMEKVFWGVDWTAYSNIFIALYLVAPNLNDPASGTEVSTSNTNYARQSVPVGSGSWTVNGLEYSNFAEITYGQPSATWGIIVGAGLFDSATGGELLYYAPLTTSKSVSAGDGAPKILANQLRITRATC